MNFLRDAAKAILVSILFCSPYWQVKTRIFTNLYLTLNELARGDYTSRIRNLVSQNVSTIIQDRIGYIYVALSGRTTARFLERFSKPIGIEKLHSAKAKNQGVVVFSAHMGHYFLIPTILASMGYEVTAVRKLDSALSHMLERRVERLNKSGMNLTLEMVNSYERLVLLRLLNDLRKNRIVFLMADYPAGARKNDGHIKFLGYNIIPARGAAWLHKKTGAPLVPIMFRYVNGEELRL